MNHRDKRQLLEGLIFERRSLALSAQLRGESARQFGDRMHDILTKYNAMGKRAQVYLIEVVESSRKREELAIFTFIKGLRIEIKRYMCCFTFYQSLYAARVHAEQIEKNLIDLNQLKRTSIRAVSETFL